MLVITVNQSVMKDEWLFAVCAFEETDYYADPPESWLKVQILKENSMVVCNFLDTI